MNSFNFEYLFTAVLPKLFSATLLSLIAGSLVGGVVGLILGMVIRRIKEILLPAILGSFVGTLLFAMLPILSEPSMRDGGGAYGGIFIMVVLITGGVPGAIIGAIVGSICGLKLPRRLKPRIFGITLAVVYSLMTIVIYSRTAPAPFQFTQASSSEEILPLVGKITGYENFTLCCMAFTPDGQQLVIAKGGGIRVWQLNTGKELKRFDGPPKPRLTLQDLATTMSVSADGKTIITSSPEGVRVRDLNTGKILHQFEGQYYSQLTPDGKKLISFVGYPNTARADIGVWDVAQGKRLYLIPSEINPYTEETPFDVSSDGKMLIVAPTSYTNRIEVWQLETGKRLTTFGGDLKKAITTLAVTPDGKTIVVAEVHQLRFLSLDTGKTVRVIPNVGKVNTLLFTPDNQILVSSGDNLSFWKVATGEKLRSWSNGFGKLVNEIALSPDGKTLAVYKQDVVKLWQMPAGSITPKPGDRR